MGTPHLGASRRGQGAQGIATFFRSSVRGMRREVGAILAVHSLPNYAPGHERATESGALHRQEGGKPVNQRETPCDICQAPATRGFWDPDGEGFVPVCDPHIAKCGFREDQVIPIPDWYVG